MPTFCKKDCCKTWHSLCRSEQVCLPYLKLLRSVVLTRGTAVPLSYLKEAPELPSTYNFDYLSSQIVAKMLCNQEKVPQTTNRFRTTALDQQSFHTSFLKVEKLQKRRFLLFPCAISFAVRNAKSSDIFLTQRIHFSDTFVMTNPVQRFIL